jgi:hypothetical protein
MKVTIASILPFDWPMPLRGFYRVTLDAPFSRCTEIAGPGVRVNLVSLEGEQIEIEGSIIFPNFPGKPDPPTQLLVFEPGAAGLREGSDWGLAFPSRHLAVALAEHPFRFAATRDSPAARAGYAAAPGPAQR